MGDLILFLRKSRPGAKEEGGNGGDERDLPRLLGDSEEDGGEDVQEL
jgi:hypothetical protein